MYLEYWQRIFRCFFFNNRTKNIFFKTVTKASFTQKALKKHTWPKNYLRIITKEKKNKENIPTTVISPWSETVWNEGASPETSHR